MNKSRGRHVEPEEEETAIDARMGRREEQAIDLCILHDNALQATRQLRQRCNIVWVTKHSSAPSARWAEAVCLGRNSEQGLSKIPAL